MLQTITPSSFPIRMAFVWKLRITVRRGARDLRIGKLKHLKVMPERKPHPPNVEGAFYVQDRCCITCDLPRTLAPDMFKYTDKKDHCYVYKQPQTEDEMGRMIQAMEGAEVLCVRCRSREKKLLQLLKKRGLAKQCDS